MIQLSVVHTIVQLSKLHLSKHTHRSTHALLKCRAKKQPTLVATVAIASRVSGPSAVTSQVQQCQEGKPFRSGRMTSGHLPLVHGRTNVTLV